jgi:hypothetical protein
MKVPLVALVLLLPCCALPTMQVKPELAAGMQLPFDRPTFGAGSSVRFGAYQAASVDRTAFEGGSSSVSSPLLFPSWLQSLESFDTHQDYAFDLQEAGRPLGNVRCRADAGGRRMVTQRGSSSSVTHRLHCALWTDPGSREFARLDLRDGRGQVQLGERRLDVEARDLHGRFDAVSPAGYALIDAGRDVAAVQTVNSGAAWIAGDLDAPARSLAATAAAALLLYRE